MGTAHEGRAATHHVKTCAHCGKEAQQSDLACPRCGTLLPATPKADNAEPPPALPAPQFVRPEDLEHAFALQEGFHRADWKVVANWIEAHIEEPDREAAWDEAALLWVCKLRDDLGGRYFVLQSRHTILLTDKGQDCARWLLAYAGRAAISIRERLATTAWQGAFGKDVILVFSEQDDYYQYLSYHSAEGEQAASGGVCIHSGLTHIALPWHDETEAANTIIHELTHDCLAHLPLPLWLNEGVAVTLQKAIAPPPRGLGQSPQDALFGDAIGWRPPMMWDELAERHFAFWTPENIQSFWAGTSFFAPGDPNELSYSLAEVLVKLLSEKGDAAAFRAFLEAARQEDAGQTAAMDILGADLGEIAGTFLGTGDWRPNRKSISALWREAGWSDART